MTNTPNAYMTGVALSASGMILLSPDGLILRLVENAGSWEIAFWRTAFLGLSLTTFCCLWYGATPWRLWRGLGRAGLSSALLLGVSNIGFVTAITYTSVANTLVILATMPFFAALIARVVIKERLPPRTWVAIFLAVAGVGWIFLGSSGGGTLAGDLAALATAFCHGANLVVLRQSRKRLEGAPLTARALSLSGFIAAAIALPFAAPGTVSGSDLAILAFSGGFQVPAAFMLFLSGIRYLPAAEVALFSLLETILGPAWAWIGVGEVPPPQTLAGSVLVIVAIAGNAIAGWRGTRTGWRGTRTGWRGSRRRIQF